MNDEGVLRAFPLHLAHRLDVGQRLDVAHRPADLRDDEVVIALGAEDLDAALDFIGDVRNDLHRLAEVFAAPLLVDDALVNPPRGDVVRLRGAHVEEALVMAEVQIRFRPIHRHIAFPVLVRIQRSRVDVDVWVQLLDGHGIAACLEELCEGGGNDAFAQARTHASGYENVTAVVNDRSSRFCGGGSEMHGPDSKVRIRDSKVAQAGHSWVTCERIVTNSS